MVAIASEHDYPARTFVGRIVRVDERGIVLFEVDTEGAWLEPEEWGFEDLTALSFGGRYEVGLGKVAGSLDGRWPVEGAQEDQ